MQNNFKFFAVLTVIGLAAALTACGGGGGDSGSAVLPVSTVAAPVASTTSLVLSVPAPNYLSGELAAFNLLNAERSRCGFGMLAQNTTLDMAARGHADWQLLNHISGHIQRVGDIGFTGVTPADRIAVASYATLGQFESADEIFSVTGTDDKTGKGTLAIRGLLNAPYHAKGLLSGFREFGVAVRNSTDSGSTNGSRIVVQIDLASKVSDGTQVIGDSDVMTYPCNGSTNIESALKNETPNPVPGRDLSINPLGSSVYIAVRPGRTLSIASARMIKVATGTAVLLRTPVTGANDPYGPCYSGCYLSHEGYVAADSPLESNTEYQVTITGSNNGSAFTPVVVNFTTGS